MTVTAEEVLPVIRDLEVTEISDGRLTRLILIRREFDCFDACAFDSPRCLGRGSGGFHGIGGRAIIFGVAVEGHGGIGFELLSPIYLDSTVARNPRVLTDWHPVGAVDFHYARPPEYLAEYGSSNAECKFTGGVCWSDVTYLASNDCCEALVRGGAAGVWALLAERYLPQIMNEEQTA